MKEVKYVTKQLHWNVVTNKRGNVAELTADFKDDELQYIVIRGVGLSGSVMYHKDEVRDALIGLKVAIDELDKIVNG